MSPPVAGRPVVGMVGAGQLARMTAEAASALGLRLRVLAGAVDDSAATVAADTVLGDHRSLDDLVSFAAGCDVVTFDHEQVPPDHLQALTDKGLLLRPPAAALRFAQDKPAMRRRLGEIGVPVPAWAPVRDRSDGLAFAAERGWPVVVKSARGGYDGHGVRRADDPEQLDRALAELGPGPVYVEEWVRLDRELAVLLARRAGGELRAWPVVETVQSAGICTAVLAPAPDLPAELAEQARSLAGRIAERLGVEGVLAVELFESAGRLVVNELAMRPHNSGHWTIEGAVTSQFEQHLRAVLDWPLGDTAGRGSGTVMVNLLGGLVDPLPLLPVALAADPGARVHLYGKAHRPGRKLGHVTVTASGPGPGTELSDLRARADRVVAILRGEPG